MRENKKNILVLTSNFPRWEGDGTTPFVAQFCENLALEGNRVFVLAPHAKNASAKEHKNNVSIKRFRYFFPESQETIAYDGGAVQKIKKSPAYAVKLIFFMISLCYNALTVSLSKNIDVINGHWIIPQGFVAVLVKKVTRKKVVITVHGGDVFTLNNKILVAIKRFVLRNADEVIVNSTATLSACKNIYANREYAIIPMGVDVEYFRPRPAPKDLKKRYGLDGFTVLFVGRLIKQKGALTLCKALKKFAKDHKNFKALIVGDGPQLAELREYVQGNNLSDNVVFTGWINPEEVAKFYNSASVFVGPSEITKGGWQEALGLVFAEALASGVPVIATKSGGIVDVVEDGKSGFLLGEVSADAIYKKLRYLYEQPELLAKMSKNGRDKMVEQFSWKSVIKRYLSYL